MFEFVRTETGWRIFWGIDPWEARAEEAHAALSLRTSPIEEAREIPVLILADAAGLGPMAI
jgi:hypothetical protein